MPDFHTSDTELGFITQISHIFGDAQKTSVASLPHLNLEMFPLITNYPKMKWLRTIISAMLRILLLSSFQIPNEVAPEGNKVNA